MTDTIRPWADGIYSIKRHGVSLTNCDSEPVQTPGCIQANGVLLVLRLLDLTILQASGNSAQFLNKSPECLLGQSLGLVVGEANALHLRAVLAHDPVQHSPLYVFTLPAKAGVPALDVCTHIIDGVAILEFEATDRTENPSTIDYFSRVKESVQRLQTSNSLRGFCQGVTQEVRNLTQLDRVMVYRFHADLHGEVFAESKRDDLPPWLGLHYPESDIPKPARDIFKKLWIRPLSDASGELVELLPLANPDTGLPLNMTYCALRGASVMYTEYLTNMGVVAALTMPIMIDGELWGLIACHHLTPRHFPYQLRAACELLAQVTSLQLKSAEQREQLLYRLRLEGIHQQLVAKAAMENDLLALSDSQPSLLDAMDATGAALYHLGRWWCAGQTPTEPQLEALAEWLNQRPEFELESRPVFATHSLSNEYPGGAELAAVASGVLAVRVSRLRRSLVVWFRPETIQTVNWAGNPKDKPLQSGSPGVRLNPRRSFDLFVESVRQRALPWSLLEIDSAIRLRLLVMELVISRSEQLTALNVDLTNSNEELDAFAYVASHDLKEPLRGIQRYAHQLLDGAQNLDVKNRQRVENLMQLTVRMDSLLDSLLHFARVGRTSLEFEAIDFNDLLAEALEMIGIRQNDNTCTIVLPRPLPTIDCDAVRVREIFSNLVSNAIKYNHHACPRIELGYFAVDDLDRPINAFGRADGQIIFYVRDDGIGIEQRHFEQIFRMFKRLHGREGFGGGVGAGLTVVKKVVHRHGGTIWLDSTIGVGSTFYFTLPCLIRGGGG